MLPFTSLLYKSTKCLGQDKSFPYRLYSMSFRGLRLELESVREELRNSREGHAAEILSLTQQLAAERERREEGREGREGEGRSLVERRNQQLSGGRRAERLRSRLRSQVEQSNYLRVKLGITQSHLPLTILFQLLLSHLSTVPIKV